MKRWISRITILPILLMCYPLIYFISWCLMSHKETVDMLNELFHDFWYGINTK